MIVALCVGGGLGVVSELALRRLQKLQTAQLGHTFLSPVMTLASAKTTFQTVNLNVQTVQVVQKYIMQKNFIK